jgi:hypothetical protein
MKSGAIVTVTLAGGFTREFYIPHATGISRISMPEPQPDAWAPLVVLCRTRRHADTPPSTPEPPRSLSVNGVLVNGALGERVERRPPPVKIELEPEADAPIVLSSRRRPRQ